MKKDLTSANGLDPGLENTLRGIIKEEQFHEFTDLLIEIMLRRQEEFGLDEKRIIKEAENLTKRLPAIQVVHQEELSNPKWAAQSGKDGIKISYEAYKSVLEGNDYLRESLYETLVHEVYHSIAINEQGYSGITNPFFAARGLNELVNEAAANRASTNYSNSERQRGIRETGGYSNLTMFSSMLAASFGVSEKELLAAGIAENGEYGLQNILMKNIDKKPPQNQAEWTEAHNKVNRAQNLIATLSWQFEILHNMDIPMSERDKNIPPDLKKNYREAALTSLLGTMFDAASYRLETDDRAISPEMVEEYAHSFKSMISFMNQVIPEYARRGLIDQAQAQRIMQNASAQINEFGNRVLGTRAVLEMQNYPNFPQSKDYLTYLAKTGQLMGNQGIADSFGITIPQDLVGEIYGMDTSRRAQYILEEDFGGKTWDNSGVSTEITDIFREKSKHLEKFSIISYFRNIIKSIQNIGRKRLNAQDPNVRAVSEIIDETTSSNNIDFKKNREVQARKYLEVVNTLPEDFARYIEVSRISGVYKAPITTYPKEIDQINENNIEQLKKDDPENRNNDSTYKRINTSGDER